MEDKTLKIYSYKITNAEVVLPCSFCYGKINVDEKYIRLKIAIGDYYQFKPIFLHYPVEECKKTVEEIKKTKKENRAIEKIALQERKIQFAKACSSEEIIQDRQKIKELFDLGYQMLTATNNKKTALAEAKAFQESGKITSIAFFDEWFEVWVKKV
jgi:hypothetical protein